MANGFFHHQFISLSTLPLTSLDKFIARKCVFSFLIMTYSLLGQSTPFDDLMLKTEIMSMLLTHGNQQTLSSDNHQPPPPNPPFLKSSPPTAVAVVDTTVIHPHVTTSSQAQVAPATQLMDEV